MTSDREDPGCIEDVEFERWLLDSARDDELMPAAPAFAKFAASLSGVALQAPTPILPSSNFAGRRALTWFGVGALGGSAVTALWFGFVRLPSASQHTAEAPALVHSAVSSAAGQTALPAPSSSPSLLQEPELLQEPRIASPSRAASRGAVRADQASASSASAASAAARTAMPNRSSTLLAEVAMLDAVRAKLSLSDASGARGRKEPANAPLPEGRGGGLLGWEGTPCDLLFGSRRFWWRDARRRASISERPIRTSERTRGPVT